MTQQLNGSTAAPAAPSGLTYEQFLGWPHENPYVEWVDGETITMPPITDEHDDVFQFLLPLLKHFVQEYSLGQLRCEPFQMKTGPDLPGRSPDIFFVGSARMDRFHKLFLDGPADLAIEIVSPGSQTRDRIHKFKEYEQGGVREYWLIDPQRRQAEFYVLGDDGLYRSATVEGGVYRSTVLDGLWIKVDWLWDRPQLKQVLKAWGLM